MRLRLLYLAALAVAGCSGLDPQQGNEPMSVSAFSDEDPITLKPGERRILAIQVLDADGAGVNGVPVIFVRPQTDLLRFDSDRDGTLQTVTTQTGTSSVFGLEANGVAVSAVTAIAGTGGGSAEIFAGVGPDVSSDAPARFVVFRLSLTGADAGTTDAGKGDAP